LTVTDSDGAQNYSFADATVLKGCIYLQSNKMYVTYCIFLAVGNVNNCGISNGS